MSDCKGCNGFNAGLGDYCPACLTAARQIERKAEGVTLVVSHTKGVTSKVSHTAGDSPTRTCSRCHNDRAIWSKSYCKGCHAKRVKAWRHTAQVDPPTPRIEV